MLAAALVAGLGAAVVALAIRASDDPTRTAGQRPRPQPSEPRATVPSVAPPSPAPAAPAPPFAVGVMHAVFVDPTRATSPRGAQPGAPVRELPVTIRYPASGAPFSDAPPDTPALAGPFPLLVFAHGYGHSDLWYAALLHEIAAQGFVVASPEFPLSSGARPGPPIRDVVEQAFDVSVVIDRMLDPATRPPVVAGAVGAPPVGVLGHSDGAVTALGVAVNSCCADPRVGAVASFSGALIFFPSGWFDTAALPLLVVHGTADEVNPLGASTTIYAAAPPPKMLVVAPGGSHDGPFREEPWRPAVARLTAEFFRASLSDDASARARLSSDAEIPGVLELRAWE